MNVIDIINKTKRKQELTEEEIRWLINSYTNDEIYDYQMSSWLMAVCLNGLTEAETAALTIAMRDSGDVLDLSGINGITVDKHSTGGVGDKTSLIIGPAVAACGVKMPKMSGRGLGHTGGTIDKLESINGYRTDILMKEFFYVVNKTGFSIISQSGNLCPADKKIYALRNSTGTVDSIPLICASIMSKKLALNSDCILLDVKCGSGAFMKNEEDANKLASLMESVGKAAGKKCRAIVTDMNTPLGMNIGNSLEVLEAVEILKGKRKGKLYDICIELAANILELAGYGDMETCRNNVKDVISSGKAYKIFKETVKLHGGDSSLIENTDKFPEASHSYSIKAACAMKITGIDSEEIGMTSLLIGAGRIAKEDEIDMTAGIIMNCECGEIIGEGETIMTLYSSVCSDFTLAAQRALNAIKFEKISATDT